MPPKKSKDQIFKYQQEKKESRKNAKINRNNNNKNVKKSFEKKTRNYDSR